MEGQEQKLYVRSAAWKDSNRSFMLGLLHGRTGTEVLC
jgi:hypothetical protein